MLILGGNQLAGGYDVANSLRFDDNSSDYLTRTPSSTTNRQTWTWSGWIKRGSSFGVEQNMMHVFDDVSENRFRLVFRTDNAIGFDTGGSGSLGRIYTTSVHREASAWYHVVAVMDTTNATATDRQRIYVNGVRQPTTVAVQVGLNFNGGLVNTTNAHEIGTYDAGTAGFFDGYMAEVVLIDGSALDPTSFGEFDEDSGVWKPIDVSELTFGTNGFYLPFENSGALGQDDSGNGNNFTVINLTSIDQTTDTPTNNYCTMNPLDNYYTGATFSEGNLKIVSSNGNRGWNTGTIGVSQGKWYWEVKYVASGGSTPSDQWNYIGITDRSPSASTDILGYNNYQYSVFEFDGKVYASSSTPTTYGATFNTGDIVQIALDLDNNNIYWGLNGQWGNGSGSWNQSSPSSAISVQDPTGTLNGNYFPAFGDGGVNVAKTWQANFGNPPFTISSGNSDGNGYGNFEYSVPSGYYALNTKNLAEYG